MGQLPFQLRARRLVGFAIRDRTRRPVAQRLVQPLDEDGVQEPALAVHADPDAAAVQLVEKPGAGELDALIGIENIGLTMPNDRLL